jgi:hypothetical protein
MRSSTTGSISNSAYDLVPAFGLIRGARGDLGVQSNWEYFCGTPASPAWCSSAGTAKNIIIKSAKKFAPRRYELEPGTRQVHAVAGVRPNAKHDRRQPPFLWWDHGLGLGEPMGSLAKGIREWGRLAGGTSTSICGSTNWGAGERADIPTKYMSGDGKTFYLFSSGGDCLSIARGVLP